MLVLEALTNFMHRIKYVLTLFCMSSSTTFAQGVSNPAGLFDPALYGFSHVVTANNPSKFGEDDEYE